jgi:hypothetical protein
MVKFKFYKFLLKWFLIFFLPFFFIGKYLFQWWISLHSFYTKVYNRLFWWKDKKYTFPEIQSQWKKDKLKLYQLKQKNWKKKQTKSGGGLKIS